MSSYNYSFNNPVMWNDPSGMGPEDEDKVKLDNGNTISADYYPKIFSKDLEAKQTAQGLNEVPYEGQSGMGAFQYIHDKNSGEDFTVMTYLNSDTHYSWVNKDSGKPELFYNDERNIKDGKWTGSWVQYETAEQNQYRLGKLEGSKNFGYAVTIGLIAVPVLAAAAPFVAGSGLFAVQSLSWSSVGTGAANLTAQVITNKGSSNPNASIGQDLEDRFKQVNITSVVAAIVLKNPFAGEALASGFRFRIADKEAFEQSYFLGNMSTKEYVLNVGIVGSLGKYSNYGLNQVTKGLAPAFGTAGVKFILGTSSYGVNTLTNIMGNVVVPTIMDGTEK